MRTLLWIVGFACLSSCAYAPPGSCNTNTDCRSGARCDNGVCVVGCSDDSHCFEWQACNVDSQRCEPRPGNCAVKAHCEAWEVCTANVCTLAPGACVAATDCASHETCTDHVCRLAAGRCNIPNDCPGTWPGCDASHTCQSSTLGGSDVIIWGTLSEGACYMDAVAPLTQPARARVGFGCYSDGDSAWVRPDGSIIYVDEDGQDPVARVFVPDEFKRENGWWRYPAAPEENDPAIPTPGCTPMYDLDLLVQEGTGRVLHRCDGAGDWFDSAGTLVVSGSGIRAWNASGHFLATESAGNFVVDAQGNRTAISGLPLYSWYDARAGGSGFIIALGSSSDNVLQLWEVDASGQATKRADYAPIPAGVTSRYGVRLDRDGTLYQEGGDTSEAFLDVIVKHPPDGSAASVVYSEANAPANANDFTASTLSLYTFLHISYLVRGP